MTEHEKQQAGMVYNAVEPELIKDLYACHDLCWEYNQIRPANVKERNEKIRVVVKDIPSNSVAVGNPAKVVKKI
ncbi:MAG: maltose acetyltransferase domain-containing protein [Bacteroidales bacterium]|nr:maltose acetyltransferase domain-containing protein [Bacteroidales bacterium]